MKISEKYLREVIKEELQKEMFFGKLDDLDASEIADNPIARGDIESGLHIKNKKMHRKLALRAIEKIEDGMVDQITDEEAFALKQYVKSME